VFSEHLQQAVESLSKAKLKEQQRTEFKRILSQSLSKIADKTDKRTNSLPTHLIQIHNHRVST
jgi:hypothetical protein